MPKRTYRRKARRAPRRKTRTIRKRRVTRRRRPRRTNSRAAMVRAPTPVTSFLAFPSNHRPRGLPESKRVKLRYAFSFNFTKTTGDQWVTHSFNGNSVYDPDRSGVGHQPRFYDQMSQLYSKYFVHGSAFNASYNNTNNSTRNYCAILIAQPANTTKGRVPFYGTNNSELVGVTSIGSPAVASEVPRIKVLQSSNPFYNSPGVLKSKAKTSTILDMKNQSKEDFYGVSGNFGTGSDPINTWLWTFAAGPADGTTASEAAGTLQGYIEYDVTFFKPFPIGES